MSAEFIVSGTNAKAPFHLKIYRGDGMALLGMNWKKGRPPKDFVGFAIELKAPNSSKFISLSNRIAFPGVDGNVNPKKLSSRLSPIQKFRWVNFPFNAELKGEFVYRVTPVFMDKGHPELWRTAGGRYRTASRNLPGSAERDVYSRLCFIPGICG